MGIGNDLRRIINAKPSDYLSVFPMVAAMLASPFVRKKYKNTWIISDRPDEALDNGYFFFRYMRKEHPEQECVFPLNKESSEFEKVSKLGKVVSYGSIMHWILYLTAQYNIGSVGGHPNGYLCTALERLNIVHPSNVFLQHGITKDHAAYIQADRRKFRVFITGAAPEFRFVRDTFGYEKGVVQYTGFARFDMLHDFSTKKNRILIMPTWRSWLLLNSERNEFTSSIHDSEFIQNWRGLIESDEFSQIIDKYNLEVVFFPHSNMQSYLSDFKFKNEKVIIASKHDYSVQELMKSSALLITDYSSVFFDMAYMKKPTIFFQFDEDKYRKYHYQKGWFDYHNTYFGKSCSQKEQVLLELERNILSDFKVDDAFDQEHSRVFALFDTKNCERIYELLKNLQEKVE